MKLVQNGGMIPEVFFILSLMEKKENLLFEIKPTSLSQNMNSSSNKV